MYCEPVTAGEAEASQQGQKQEQRQRQRQKQIMRMEWLPVISRALTKLPMPPN